MSFKNGLDSLSQSGKVFIEVFNEYTDFTDIFSLNLTVELFKHMRINNHAIKLLDD